MSKKFARYSKLDLSNVNKEILKKWQDGDIFQKSLEMKVLLRRTVCPVFITLLLVR